MRRIRDLRRVGKKDDKDRRAAREQRRVERHRVIDERATVQDHKSPEVDIERGGGTTGSIVSRTSSHFGAGHPSSTTITVHITRGSSRTKTFSMYKTEDVGRGRSATHYFEIPKYTDDMIADAPNAEDDEVYDEYVSLVHSDDVHGNTKHLRKKVHGIIASEFDAFVKFLGATAETSRRGGRSVESIRESEVLEKEFRALTHIFRGLYNQFRYNVMPSSFEYGVAYLAVFEYNMGALLRSKNIIAASNVVKDLAYEYTSRYNAEGSAYEFSAYDPSNYTIEKIHDIFGWAIDPRESSRHYRGEASGVHYLINKVGRHFSMMLRMGTGSRLALISDRNPFEIATEEIKRAIPQFRHRVLEVELEHKSSGEGVLRKAVAETFVSYLRKMEDYFMDSFEKYSTFGKYLSDTKVEESYETKGSFGRSLVEIEGLVKFDGEVPGMDKLRHIQRIVERLRECTPLGILVLVNKLLQRLGADFMFPVHFADVSSFEDFHSLTEDDVDALSESPITNEKELSNMSQDILSSIEDIVDTIREGHKFNFIYIRDIEERLRSVLKSPEKSLMSTPSKNVSFSEEAEVKVFRSDSPITPSTHSTRYTPRESKGSKERSVTISMLDKSIVSAVRGFYGSFIDKIARQIQGEGHEYWLSMNRISFRVRRYGSTSLRTLTSRRFEVMYRNLIYEIPDRETLEKIVFSKFLDGTRYTFFDSRGREIDPGRDFSRFVSLRSRLTAEHIDEIGDKIDVLHHKPRIESFDDYIDAGGNVSDLSVSGETSRYAFLDVGVFLSFRLFFNDVVSKLVALTKHLFGTVSPISHLIDRNNTNTISLKDLVNVIVAKYVPKMLMKPSRVSDKLSLVELSKHKLSAPFFHNFNRSFSDGKDVMKDLASLDDVLFRQISVSHLKYILETMSGSILDSLDLDTESIVGSLSVKESELLSELSPKHLNASILEKNMKIPMVVGDTIIDLERVIQFIATEYGLKHTSVRLRDEISDSEALRRVENELNDEESIREMYEYVSGNVELSDFVRQRKRLFFDYVGGHIDHEESINGERKTFEDHVLSTASEYVETDKERLEIHGEGIDSKTFPEKVYLEDEGEEDIKIPETRSPTPEPEPEYHDSEFSYSQGRVILRSVLDNKSFGGDLPLKYSNPVDILESMWRTTVDKKCVNCGRNISDGTSTLRVRDVNYPEVLGFQFAYDVSRRLDMCDIQCVNSYKE